MNAALKLAHISLDDYLASERTSPIKREYVAGAVYAMGGGTFDHARIIGNVYKSLSDQLGDGPCEAFLGETQVRITLDDDFCLYYPDVYVACEHDPLSKYFHERPVLVVEVLSPSTRRIDAGEKREHYLSIPTLQYYLLIEQEGPGVVVYRRGENGFEREIVSDLAATIDLQKLRVALPLSVIYHRVSFDAE